jgi:hypothetical protein
MTDELPPMQQRVVLDHDFRRHQRFVLCHDLGHFLLQSTAPTMRSRQRKPRKPSVGRLIRQAEKATGKAVTSITTDGVTLTFGEPQPTEANNPWLADLDKVIKQ